MAQIVFDTNIFHARIHGAPVQIDIEARFSPPGGEERACRIVQASTGEMVFSAPLRPRYGDRIAVYASEFGHFEGDVERETEDGFAISLNLTETRRRKFAAQLTWRANREICRLPETRRHKRIVPKMQWTRLRMPDGTEKVARINDVSLAAVSAETAAEAAIGDRVAFGVKTAVVSRVFEGGFVAQFEEPFAEGELSEETWL